ncbi:anti-repressor SinI family protein [Bacillus sp. 1P06AnD]|uniref:anti-repressor SinI family protein n=1 Tax=Bacillus sp. 1P06AnD TaxID=3132208 RepID=UPI0039A2E31B
MSELNQEWIQLILEAKEIGLSIEEIREFLQLHLDRTKNGTFVDKGVYTTFRADELMYYEG